MLDRPVSPTPVTDDVLKLWIWQGVVVVTVGDNVTTVLLMSPPPFAEAGPASDTKATTPAATARTRRRRSEWWTDICCSQDSLLSPRPSRPARRVLERRDRPPSDHGRSTRPANQD